MTISKTTIVENENYILEASPIDETDGSAISGATVTYVIKNSSDESTLASGTLAEVGVTGLYKATYTFAAKGNYKIIYSCAGYPDSVESIFVTDMNTDVTAIRKIETNRWKLDGTAYTFTVYDDDGSTPLYVWDLTDAGGSPSVNAVFERVPQ
jgi:hypothetical protein